MRKYVNVWNFAAVVASVVLGMIRNISGPSVLFLLHPFVLALVATLVVDRQPFYVLARIVNGVFAVFALVKLSDHSLTLSPFIWLSAFVLTVIPPILNAFFLGPNDDQT